jgi:hypothetical protein
MSITMSNFDRWLEKPYTDRAREEAEFEEFCEAQGIDFDDPEADALFQAWQDSFDEGPDPDDARDLAYENAMDGYEPDYGD